MKRIYKYQILSKDECRIDLPDGYEIIDFAVQKDIICFWAIVDDEQTLRNVVVFKVYATDEPLTSTAKEIYLGTVHTLGGFVWHIFKVC